MYNIFWNETLYMYVMIRCGIVCDIRCGIVCDIRCGIVVINNGQFFDE